MDGSDDTIDNLTLDNASLDTGVTATLTLTGDLSNGSSTSQVSLAGQLALAAGSHNFHIADPYNPSTPDMVDPRPRSAARAGSSRPATATWNSRAPSPSPGRWRSRQAS